MAPVSSTTVSPLHESNGNSTESSHAIFKQKIKKTSLALSSLSSNEEYSATEIKHLIAQILSEKALVALLDEILQKDVFSHEFHDEFIDSMEVLGSVKELKYFFNLPLGQVFTALNELIRLTPLSSWWGTITKTILRSEFNTIKTRNFLKENNVCEYDSIRDKLEQNDAHAVYPTNIFRQCNGKTVSSSDFSTIESVMSTTLTTNIKIRKRVLDINEPTLAKIYKPLNRCIAIVDSKVDSLYGNDLNAYFTHHDIKLTKLVYKGNEVDKEIENVEKILVDLKQHGVARNEPVLIVGGGVISDIGGFACALYHRSTPYVMLCTSIVSGIDAGPSPRTCCDGFGFKNMYGAYHPPVQTITDRFFFRTLHPGWLRHGIAEIIKMSVTKDFQLFQLLERAGPKLITTKFGTDNCDNDVEFEKLCDLIIGRALDSYVKSEYGNLWETHQCRPHAYGHTWSPGYELSAGMLHGQAVATGMGFGAYLSFVEGWITRDEFDRILDLISKMELALWHPIMDNVDMIWASQVKMVQKRGGNLCAPIPRGGIGKCGYLNDLPYDILQTRLAAYKEVCSTYPRQGLGVDMHCKDVGLEDPSKEAIRHTQTEIRSKTDSIGKSLTYNEWIKAVQTSRNADWKFNVSFKKADDTEKPPHFDAVTLFNRGCEDYAMKMTSLASENVQIVAKKTTDNSMFAPCMVGTLESQFLKMQIMLAGAKRCLDVGTFTGMSAIAMAEGLPVNEGEVVTLEFDDQIADVAQEAFNESNVGQKINLIRGNAVDAMKEMLKRGEKFDVIFLDADKENYLTYYKIAMDGLLTEGKGFIMADNSLCALLYDTDDIRRQRLHEFNQFVKNDKRVEQVVLTLREGVTIIKPI